MRGLCQEDAARHAVEAFNTRGEPAPTQDLKMAEGSVLGQRLFLSSVTFTAVLVCHFNWHKKMLKLLSVFI